jgi:uncharacterized protein (DUF885 family)
MRHSQATSIVILITLMSAGCSRREHGFSSFAEEFVYTTLSFSPISATASGLHQYKGQALDEQLDDMSPATLDHQRQYFERCRQHLLNDVQPDKLSPESRADYGIIENQVSLALLDLEETQSYLHNPTVYVELAGNALFVPLVLEYAPKETRMRHIIARLQKLPLFLDQARTNLISAPDVWTATAEEENAGNIELVDKILRDAAPAGMRADYDRAARPALDALHGFQDYLQKSLSTRDSYDWRLGRDRYARKFRYALASGADPADVLQSAEKALQDVRARMMQIAEPLDRMYFPGRKETPAKDETERQNSIISEVLDRIALRRSTPASYMDDARHDLDDARQFVQRKHLLTLPPRANLQVVPTPEFMRGSYPVGGFNPAPALEPQLGAFYWITPIPADWPAARVDSKLREYNFYKLKLLTMHEAIPGHYVQGEYANDVQPPSRRLLRAVYGNGPYIEGWAQYATQMMLDEGLLDNSPELRLTFQKEELRVVANAILDVRLQMLNMSDQEALDLMEKQTFQEQEEATAKLRRAKLTSAQLPTYFAGWRGWLRTRDQYRQLKGGAFRLSEFNDAALKEGAVPLTELENLIAAPPAPK